MNLSSPDPYHLAPLSSYYRPIVVAETPGEPPRYGEGTRTWVPDRRLRDPKLGQFNDLTEESANE